MNIENALVESEESDQFYGVHVLRWYQIFVRRAIVEAIRKGSKRIAVVLPTGTGKTVTIACTIGSSDIKKALGITEDRKIRVMFVAHRHRLLTQAEATFATDNNVDLTLRSIFADFSNETEKYDVVIFDEGQHEPTNSWQTQLAFVDTPIIYLTATPERGDRMLLKADTVIEPMTRHEAVEQGYIAETDLFSFVDPSGTYKTPILKEILDNNVHKMEKTFCFVRTRREVEEIAAHAASLGRKAVALLNQSDAELDIILNKFSAGEIDFIVNCNRISEGVDVKGCTDVIMGRQVGSYIIMNQTIGRAARIDSPCRIYELVSPLNGRNLDTTSIVGEPKSHILSWKQSGQWVSQEFEYA